MQVSIRKQFKLSLRESVPQIYYVARIHWPPCLLKPFLFRNAVFGCKAEAANADKKSFGDGSPHFAAEENSVFHYLSHVKRVGSIPTEYKTQFVQAPLYPWKAARNVLSALISKTTGGISLSLPDLLPARSNALVAIMSTSSASTFPTTNSPPVSTYRKIEHGKPEKHENYIATDVNHENEAAKSVTVAASSPPTTTVPSGPDVATSLKHIEEEFTCPVCLELLIQATTMVPCGHLFCRSCVASLAVCSVCAATVSTRVPCRTMDNVIATLVASRRFFYPDDEQAYRERLMEEQQRAAGLSSERPHLKSHHPNPCPVVAASASTRHASNGGEGTSVAQAICIE